MTTHPKCEICGKEVPEPKSSFTIHGLKGRESSTIVFCDDHPAQEKVNTVAAIIGWKKKERKCEENETKPART